MIPALLLAAVLAQTELATPRPVSGIRYGLNAHRATLQYRPRITPGDGAFLVTWGDYRNLVPTPPTYNFSPPVNGAAVRVGTDGKLLDSSAIGLPVAPNAVVWNGEHWIVMSATHYVRIDRSGELLDPTARALTTPIPAKGQFHAAAVGNTIVVGTSETRDINNGRVVAVVHEANMRRIQQVNLLSPAYAGGEVLGVASDGETVMVLYRDQQLSVPTVFPIRSAIFDRRGFLQSNAIVYEPTFNTEVSLGATEDGYMFIVRTHPSAATYEAVFVGRNNEVQYKSAVFAAVENRLHDASAPTLAWDGTAFSFFTVWRSRNGPANLFVTRMGGDGVLAGPPVKLMAWESLLDLKALAAERHAGATLLVTPAFADPIAGGERLLARAAADPAALGSVPGVDLIVGVYPQETPSIASSNSQSLVVWRERTKLQHWLRPLFDVFATRVTDSGIALDLQPIAVAASSCNELWPLVVSDGARFLVIWADGTNVNARQVGADGRLGQTRSIFLIGSCDTVRAMKLAAASNGTDTLVVFSAPTSTATVRNILGVRVGPDGALLNTQFISIGETRDGSAIPRVASDGSGWLVTFGDEAVRVASSGITLPGFITFGGDGQAEDVFWNGGTYAAWVRYPSGEYRLFRIAQDGSSPGVGQPLPQPLPVPALPLTARDFWCERGVCLAPHGEQLLRVNADLSVELIDAGLTPDRLSTAIGGVAAPVFVYLRRLSMRPFGGVPRVFVQGSRSSTRGRAVRH